MDFQRLLFLLMASTFHPGIYKLNLMLFYLLKERYRQISTFNCDFSAFFHLKRMYVKRQKRKCWVKAGGTNAWWKLFQNDEVPTSETQF